MGIFFSKKFDKLFRSCKETKIIIIGLDGAGKTTILYQLKLSEITKKKTTQTSSSSSMLPTVPTIGFNIETVKYKNVLFKVWDVGGSENVRSLWKYYYEDANGIIFVIDSGDINRIDHDCYCNGKCDQHCAYDEFRHIIEETSSNKCPILIFANKQDLLDVMSINEISQRLGLLNIKNRKWYLQSTCAITGQGLQEGLAWLAKNIPK